VDNIYYGSSCNNSYCVGFKLTKNKEQELKDIEEKICRSEAIVEHYTKQIKELLREIEETTEELRSLI